MRWQCALLKRWLPEYPDGDLPAFWQARLKSHLARCPACRQELAALQEVVRALQAAPAAAPGPEFWAEFDRELHLKLAHAAPGAPRPRGYKLLYLVGAPALAVLALWFATQFSDPGRPLLNQVQMSRVETPPPAAKAKMAPSLPKAEMAAGSAPAEVQEPLVFVAVGDNGLTADQEEDLVMPGWDLEPVLAGMTDQEKEIFLQKLDQKKKDGSCHDRFSAMSSA